MSQIGFFITISSHHFIGYNGFVEDEKTIISDLILILASFSILNEVKFLVKTTEDISKKKEFVHLSLQAFASLRLFGVYHSFLM